MRLFLKFFLLFLLCYFVFDGKGELKAQSKRDGIILDDRLYVPGSAWFTGGIGQGIEGKTGVAQKNFGVTMGFRANRLMPAHLQQPQYDWIIQMGYHYSARLNIWERSPNVFEEPRVNDLFLGFGLRREEVKWNLAFSLGPSFALGWYNHDDTLTTGFRQPALYTEFQYSRKLTYDLGLGLGLYLSLNPNYQTAGLRLHIYLSTAYRGKTHS